MAIKKPNWKLWKMRLKNVYRFQIVDEKSYDVKLVMELNPLNIIIGTGLILAFFTFLNFVLIAFTPLKQYIPGYGSSSGRREIINMGIKAEELDNSIKAHQKYVANLQNILNDKVVIDAVKSDLKKSKVDTGILSIKTTDESQFVKEIEKGLKNAALLESVRDANISALSRLELIQPVSGNAIIKHSDKNIGTTFSASENEPVKAVLAGNVVATSYSAEDGYTIIVQAENQLVYILKNNSQLLKKNGNFVQEGETIANAGKFKNKAFVSTLELWYRGHAIDPQKFIK